MTSDAIYRVDCPSRPILDQIAGKLSKLVLAVLHEHRRFNEIRGASRGVTQRVLTQTLRQLERNGMVVRRVPTGSPLGVEYSLPSLGESPHDPFGLLYDWTFANTDFIREHQRHFDERSEETV